MSIYFDKRDKYINGEKIVFLISGAGKIVQLHVKKK